MARARTHYDTLAIARDAPLEIIRAAYKILSQKYHPDRNPGDATAARTMVEINAAYSVLADPALRADYDAHLREAEGPTVHESPPQAAERAAPRSVFPREFDRAWGDSKSQEPSAGQAPSRAGVVVVVMICLGLAIYGAVVADPGVYTSDSATNVGFLIGRTILPAIALWILVRLTLLRRAGVGLSALAFLALFGSMVGGGLLGVERGRREALTSDLGGPSAVSSPSAPNESRPAAPTTPSRAVASNGLSTPASAAIEDLQRKATQGDSEAQTKMGLAYYKGESVRANKAQALEWFQRAAFQGHAEAQFMLGVLWHEGAGVPQDDRTAAAWFLKAAAQGYVRAEYNLAYMYANGLGVSKDDSVATKWLRKAAEHGDPKALADLRVRSPASAGQSPSTHDAEEASSTMAPMDVSDAIQQSLLMRPEVGDQESTAHSAVQYLQKLGYFAKEPDLVQDYLHIYYPRIRIDVFGYKVMAFDHEYETEYVGCCANPGVALVLSRSDNSSSAELLAFAKTNSCTMIDMDKAYLPNAASERLRVKEVGKSLLMLSCRMGDRDAAH